MVRAMVLGLVVALVVGFAGQSQAADGNLSKAVLSEMGLAGLQVITDVEGDTIRGQGFALVFGVGKAKVRDTKEVNGYIAGSDNPQGAFAIGGNIAVAAEGSRRGRCRGGSLNWAVAAGASAAYAN